MAETPQDSSLVSACVELGGAARHVRVEDAALRLEQLRQVGVVVDRDPVRIECGHLVEGRPHGFRGLLRQPVDQVDADRTETGAARGVDDRASLPGAGCG
jgi:hypothetical protein